MKDSKLEFSTADEVEAVYYEAFSHCDAEVMAALWADDNVVCVHPGSGAILGHTKVIRSWEHIFNQSQPPALDIAVMKRVVSDELAVHLVAESFANGSPSPTVVLATNVYQKFAAGWLMIEHHGSLVHSMSDGQTLQ